MMRPLPLGASKLSSAGDPIQTLPKFAASLGSHSEGLCPPPARLLAVLRGDPRWLDNSRPSRSARSINVIFSSGIKPPAAPALHQPRELKQLLSVRGEQGPTYTLGPVSKFVCKPRMIYSSH